MRSCIDSNLGIVLGKPRFTRRHQTRSSTIGLSGAVGGLSANFSAGSSQLMHWRSVRPEIVTDTFSAFRAACCLSHEMILLIFPPFG
jgi:hypothetical protein